MANQNANTVAEADQLLHWAQQHKLSPQQFQQVSQIYHLHPQSADWLKQANLILAFAAFILLSAALIFFFAYNWAAMHHLSRLALAGVALLTAAAVVLLTPPDHKLHRPALLASCVVTGAGLALIGQTYQTGADIWQLFASWALLITPLVLLSRSRACYLLWYLIIELACWRYLVTSQFGWLFNDGQLLLALAAINLALLAWSEFALPMLGVRGNRMFIWLTAALLIAVLSLGAIIGLWQADHQRNLLVYPFAGGMLFYWYYRVRRQLLVVALLLFSAIAVTTALIARFADGDEPFLTTNLLAFFVIGSSAAAAMWLKRQIQERQHEQ